MIHLLRYTCIGINSFNLLLSNVDFMTHLASFLSEWFCMVFFFCNIIVLNITLMELDHFESYDNVEDSLTSWSFTAYFLVKVSNGTIWEETSDKKGTCLECPPLTLSHETQPDVSSLVVTIWTGPMVVLDGANAANDGLVLGHWLMVVGV